MRGTRYTLIFGVDALLIIFSLYSAFSVRFEWALPAVHLHTLLLALPGLLIIRLALNMLFGIHRWSFRMSGLQEGARLAGVTLLGTVAFVFLGFFQQVGLPRSVIVLEYFFTATGLTAFRFAPRLFDGWYRDRLLARQARVRRTLIVGAGSAGDLLLRDLVRSREHRYQVVGFVDDDENKIGTKLGGKPVLGEIERLPELVRKHGISDILIAIPRVKAERIREILRLCASVKVSLKIIPVSFAYLNDRITASMLHDLSPEDLLPRDQVAFNAEEIGQLLHGRRVMVTGAGGSIGSEIARQVAVCKPRSLVLVDINENELYFLSRKLQAELPGLEIRAEVADIRDAARMDALGEEYRPQDVFHAAAHKHVPLMETAPGEAVKNNVFGTRNVAQMAVLSGAERFVLISTDKAVRPTSVMGTTKRVAELVVRDLARRSSTRFTAVRFGNVLGSAGSVVPLFKQQIERGGPVTVTHPECSRYFMTIPEAVGLVLLAGLRGYGELCVLDMGQAIKIVDLASHMITMAGLVPGEDIQIEFTGLRPGEKLTEELMTEEEEQTQVARDKICVAKSPPPPADLAERLEELRRVAESGDSQAIVRTLKALVPSYQPDSSLLERGEKVRPLRPRSLGR